MKFRTGNLTNEIFRVFKRLSKASMCNFINDNQLICRICRLLLVGRIQLLVPSLLKNNNGDKCNNNAKNKCNKCMVRFFVTFSFLPLRIENFFGKEIANSCCGEMKRISSHTVSTMGQQQPQQQSPQQTLPPGAAPTAENQSQLQARLSQPPLTSSTASPTSSTPPEGTREQLRYLLQRDKDQPQQPQQVQSPPQSPQTATTTAARGWVPGARKTRRSLDLNTGFIRYCPFVTLR